MKAEEVAAWLEVNAQSLAEQGHQRLSEQPAEEAAAIRALIAERDALRTRVARLEEPYVNGDGQSWNAPTAEAYAKTCAALHKAKAECDALRAKNERLRANWPKRHGCACKFDDDDNLVSTCQAHREIIAERDRFREALEIVAGRRRRQPVDNLLSNQEIASAALDRKRERIAKLEAGEGERLCQEAIATARRKALEEAAKECDRLAGDPRMYTADQRKAAGQCAAAIRALKDKP